MPGEYRDLMVSAADGLRLYARDYGPDVVDALPVVCLPGLARTSEDFHDLARALGAARSARGAFWPSTTGDAGARNGTGTGAGTMFASS
jgi:pimeloyl-ACP methyl ester carboxylesterase